jgi:glycosyltransferase involved in cell wall biosynthesis
VLWIDVTDLTEFRASGSTVSGVQRVEAELTPLLLTGDAREVTLDRTTGRFVGASDQVRINFTEYPNSVLVVLGATWINDQLMAAIRSAVSEGVQYVDLFYDITPVIDAGHAKHLRELFERYLALLSDCADRVPAISQSSRNDLSQYLRDHDLKVPPGIATTLPSGLMTTGDGPREATNEDFALMVGTIEARKNHLLAFHAWEKLIDTHGAENIPTLICVGKIGWNSEPFLEKMKETNNLNAKIVLRSDGVTDTELTDLYRDALFSVYPSNYEGWGLPVSESLIFGTPVVAARNSSLTEAGGDLACYFTTGDVTDFVHVIDTEMLNVERRREHTSKIVQANTHITPVTWTDIAAKITSEVHAAQQDEQQVQVAPTLNNWETYPLTSPHSVFTDRLIVGNQRPPQPWGFPVYSEQKLTINFTRESTADLTVHLGTLCEAGVVTLQVTPEHFSSQQHTFSRGEFVSVNVGAGEPGEVVRLEVHAASVGPSDQGFIGLTSITVEGESAMATSPEYENFTVTKLEAQNAALQADVDQLASELAQANAELARKSQSLLSRASRKLNRPSE